LAGLPDVSRLPPELRAEIARRASMRGSAESGFLAELHSHQLAFIRDRARRKAALCSRRAGKSFLILAWLVEGALSDVGGLSVYVARSKGNARLILTPAVDHFRQRWPELRLTLSEVDGQLMLRVGCCSHSIWLAGAKDRSEVGKFRGSKFRRVAIDEAQEYGSYLRELVTDVFEPALIDKHGDLALCGTPSPVPSGLFYEATTGDGGPAWSTHRWTLFENPHIRDAESEVRAFCAQYGLNRQSATYRREYLGEWVRDDGSLVYPYSAELNRAYESELPDGMSYVLGVDIGFTDATAFVVVGTSPLSPTIWVLEASKETGLIPSVVAARVQDFVSRYGRALRVVVDEGGAGKGYAEEMRQRYAIRCEPAEKTKKRAYQEIVAGELRSGTIRVVAARCRDLVDEVSLLQWGPGHLAQDDRFEDHASDAFLYAVRATHSRYRPPPPPGPERGTDEWHRAEAGRRRAEAKERVRKQQRRLGWRGRLGR